MSRIRRFMAAALAITMVCPITMPLMKGVRADGTGVAVNETNFPDVVFRDYVSSNFDFDSNGYLSDYEIENATRIYIFNKGLESLQGIELLPNLGNISCSYNQLTSIDVSNNTELWNLHCDNNLLTSIDVSNNPHLNYIDIDDNQVVSIDVSNNPDLITLNCSSNSISCIDVSNNPRLQTLNCSNNKLTSLDVSNNPYIEFLKCNGNNISTLDVSGIEALQDLECHYNQLTSLILNNPELEAIYCSNNQLSSLDVSDAPMLSTVNCANNQLTSLDFSSNLGLTDLDCSNNQLISLNVSNNDALERIHCEDNQLTELDASNITALESIACYSNQLTSLDVSNNPNLLYVSCSNNALVNLDMSNSPSILALSCDDNQLANLDISNLTNLYNLECQNNLLTSLDVSNNSSLVYLKCYDNQLSSLDVSNNPKLNLLHCHDNRLESLVINDSVLEELYCYNNQLTDLDVSNCSVLGYLDCNDNQLTGLDVSNNPELFLLKCESNQLDSLDVSSNPLLEILYCGNNPLTSLDVSNNAILEELNIASTDIDVIDVSNNMRILNSIAISGVVNVSEYLSQDEYYYFFAYYDENTYGYLYHPRALLNWSLSFSEEQGVIVVAGDEPIYPALPTPTPTSTPTPTPTPEITLAPTVTPGMNDVAINNTNFPDENIREWLAEEYDTDNNGYFSASEIAQITEFSWGHPGGSYPGGVFTLGEGFKYFTSLERVYISGFEYANLSPIDLSGLPHLKSVIIRDNWFTELNVSNCPELEEVFVRDNTDYNMLYEDFNDYVEGDPPPRDGTTPTINVSNCSALKYLWIFGNSWGNELNLNLQGVTTLENVHIIDCLSNLDLGTQNNLDSLFFGGDDYDSYELDISGCPLLLAYYNAGIASVSTHYNIVNYYGTDPLFLDTTDEDEDNLRFVFWGTWSLSIDEVLGHTGLAVGCADGQTVTVNADSPTPATGVDGFIARLYSEVLGREADQGGIDYWVGELNSGTTGGDAARIFLFSEEFLNNDMNDEDFVGILYAVFFDRTPDEGGLAYWMSEVTGKGKTAVIDSLIESQEWANICESYGIATGAGTGSASSDPIVAFAERLYTTCLGRSGEAGGINFWSEELRAGRYSGSEAARGFFFGAEFTNAGHDNTEFVTRLYRTFFNREPDDAGLNFWLGELGNGTTREAAFAAFTGCQEWLDTCSDAGIQP